MAADTRNIKLVVAYEGTNYSGWQRQRNVPTVQEAIENALEQVVGCFIKVQGASRTDAGVHAEGQVACFATDSPIPAEAFAWVLSRRLPPDIVIRSSHPVSPAFHASRDAARKTYIYRIYTGPTRDVLDFRRRCPIPYDLDVHAMNAAAAVMLGTHDFLAFASAKDDRSDSVRTVSLARVDRPSAHEIRFQIAADRFLYKMVRNIVGTLVEIGRGRWPAPRTALILASRDRTKAGPTAAPNGLCLLNVEYPHFSRPPLDTSHPDRDI